MAERVSLKRGQMPKQAARKPAKRVAARPAEPMVRLPLGPRRMRRWTGGAVAALVVAGGGAALWLSGIPQNLWFETARSTARAGLEVRHIEIAGLTNQPRLPVYKAALGGATNAMMLVDLDEVRGRVMTLPWVADASVGRRLPDTLTVTVVERRPVALWQYKRRLAAIDADGRVLERQRLERFGALPIVVGRNANVAARDLMAMLADQPALRARVDAASWVGGRRWDLRFKSGETLALPEGSAAPRALKQFAAMEEKSGLLAKGFARFDMRLADRMTVRTSGEPGAAIAPRAAAAI